MIRGALVAAAAVTLIGCSIKSDYGGTEYQCPDGVCPSGFSCVMGRCVTSSELDGGNGGDDGAPGDANPTGADGGMQAGGCGGPGTFVDDFGASDLDWAIVYANNGATVNVNAGELVIELPSNPPMDADGELFAARRFDLRNGRVTLEVVEMVNTANPSALELIINAAWTSYVEFIQAEGDLYLNEWVNDSLASQASIAWDPVALRWWQMREAGGTLYFETSPDGNDWTVRHSIASPSYLDSVQFYLSAETYDGIADPGRARIDNLNVATGPQPWCPMADFSDDFDDNDIGLYWGEWAHDCAFLQENGAIRLALDGDLSGDCGLELLTGHDLSGSSVHVEIPTMLNTAADAVAYFVINDFAGNGASIVQQSGTMAMYHCTPSCNSVGSLGYDPQAHRWWQMREAGGTLYYETSPDGATWTERGQITHAIDTPNTLFSMGVSNPGSATDPGELRFDNFNN